MILYDKQIKSTTGKIKVIFYTLFLILIFSHQQYQAQTNHLKLTFGFYDAGIDRAGSGALLESMKQWIEAVKKRAHYKPLNASTVETNFYSTRTELFADLQRNSLDIMSLTAWDYFGLRLSDKIKPTVIASINPDSKFERYYLVSHKDSGLDNISKLTHSQILIPKSNSSYLMNAWLKVRLTEKFGRAQASKISITESDKNENQTLVKLFFNKLDLAVIREGTYFIACELNPQIKSSTSVIEISPNYINYFLGERKGLDSEIHNGIMQEALLLHNSIEGKQILNIMKMEKVFEINISDFNETEALFNRYNRLSK